MTDDSKLQKTLNIVIARRTKSDAAIHLNSYSNLIKNQWIATLRSR
jgi:hypothetical protein